MLLLSLNIVRSGGAGSLLPAPKMEDHGMLDKVHSKRAPLVLSEAFIVWPILSNIDSESSTWRTTSQVRYLLTIFSQNICIYLHPWIWPFGHLIQDKAEMSS